MHILLTILKILGLLLLLILGMLLLLLALGLLVPIRYSARIDTGGDILRTKDAGRVLVRFEASWLFKLVYFTFELREKKVSLRLRAAWFKLLDTAATKEAAVRDPQIRSAKEAAKSQEPSTRPARNAPETREAPYEQSEEKEKDEPAAPADEAAHALEKKPDEAAPAKAAPSGEGERTKEAAPGFKEKIRARLRACKERPADPQPVGIAAKYLIALMQRATDLIFALLEAIDGRIEALEKTINRLSERIERIRPLTDWVSRSYYGWLWHLAARMLGHFRVRHVQGRLRFGAGRAALTGIAGGALTAALPADAGDFALAPDFYEAALDADLGLHGHIRLWHGAYLALRAACKKDTWMMLRRIRKR